MACGRCRNYPNARRRTKLSCTDVLRQLQSTINDGQGVADPYTHMYAYPRDSARQARGWIWLEAWPRLQAFLLPYP
jgi:hypothetical protein